MMMDLPPSHYEVVISSERQLPLNEEELFKIAEDYKEAFKDGFGWNCVSKVITETYFFLLNNKTLTREEIQEKTIVIFDHFIDIMPIPYLPTQYVDPILKKLVPSLVSLLDFCVSSLFTELPSLEHSATPSAATLSEFVEKLKGTFADGFQLHDIPFCIKASIDFVGAFPLLEKEAKQTCVLQIVDSMIDSLKTGGPDFIVHPVIKRIVHPFIQDLLNKLSNL
jgi:hypothetical protein